MVRYTKPEWRRSMTTGIGDRGAVRGTITGFSNLNFLHLFLEHKRSPGITYT